MADAIVTRNVSESDVTHGVNFPQTAPCGIGPTTWILPYTNTHTSNDRQIR